MSTLQIEGISKNFGGLRALDNVTFSVEENEILGLIGPNGAGKTTLFQIITGLERPTKGQISASGKRIDEMSPYKISRLGIARTFQILRVFHQLTVIENVMVGRHIRTSTNMLSVLIRTPVARKEESNIKSRAMEILEFVDLDHRADDMAGILPHGQQRKLEIARALATDPKILLLDEPSAGLNPQESSNLETIIRSIHETLGITILLIEHEMRLLMNVSDRIVVLNYGKKIAEGPPEKIRRDPIVIKAYLGKEYINALA